MATLPDFYVKTAAEIRDDGLRTLRNGLVRAGVPNPNVAPGSDYYVLFQAIANEIEVLGANLLVKADELMPDTATGDGLDRWLQSMRLTRREAAGSHGAVVLEASASTAISAGSQLLDGQGFRYQVTTAGTYASGALVPVEAVDAGDKTNLEAGAVLRWISAPAYAAATAVVATGGFTGGAEAEDDETARSRLLRRLGTPPGSGNWSHVVTLTEAVTPLIQAAFVYPAAQGPATQHIAVVAYASATDKTREISASTMAGVIAPAVKGALAEHADTTVTTVTDAPTDVAIDLSLPHAPSASVPGPGGGWLDGTPWPAPAPGQPAANVTAIVSSTRFSVQAKAAPVANVSRICWLSPQNWKVYTATVIQVHSFAGNVADISIDTPFTGIASGNYISPQSVNQQAYFDAVLAAFAALGPGEKTENATVLARAYRRPPPAQLWPSSLGPQVLRALSDVGREVLDVAYRYRSAPTAPVPVAVTDPPNILIPQNVGLYELGA